MVVALYARSLGGVDENQIAREVLVMLPNQFAGDLLDVPIGTAVFTHQKYRLLRQAQITGLDYSTEMLEISRIRFGGETPHNLHLIQGDVGALPFADSSFDAVLYMSGIHVFPDKQRALQEIFRVLKPGGLFFGCLYIRGIRPIADWFVRHVLDKKGLFIAPHFTLEEYHEQLTTLYGCEVEINATSPIALFHCTKP